MFGRECTLCGGKLDSRNICKECGLDNSKSEKNYRINRNSCENMPLTHVHEESWEYPAWEQTQSSEQGQASGQMQKHPGRHMKKQAPEKKKGCGCLVVFVVIFVIMTAISVIGVVVNNIRSQSWDGGDSRDHEAELNDTYDQGEELYDPYEYVDAQIPSTGDEVSYELASGRYIVGVHIAPGYYVAEPKNDFDSVQVSDLDQGIYLYEYVKKEEGHYLEDLRLFAGAVVEIKAIDPIPIHTKNGQLHQMDCQINPLAEGYVINDTNTHVAGRDFAPGVYDLEAAAEYAEVIIRIYTEGTEVYLEDYLWMGDDASGGVYYKNLVLPDGAELICEEGMQLFLTPSEVIESTDYQGYYSRY